MKKTVSIKTNRNYLKFFFPQYKFSKKSKDSIKPRMSKIKSNNLSSVEIPQVTVNK